MPYALPDSRIENASLKSYDTVPVGRYEVDKRHWIAHKMTGFFLPGSLIQGVNGFGCENLMKGYRDLTFTTASSADPVRVMSDKGRVVDLNDQFLASPEVDTPEFISADGVTIAALYRLDTHQSSGGSPICRAVTSSSSSTYYATKDYSNRSQFAARIGGSNRTIVYNTGITLGQWVFRIGLYDKASGRMELWDRELGLIANNSYAGDLSTATGSERNFRIACGKQDDANRGFDGVVAMAAVWNGIGIDATTIEAFFNDYKQVLIPA
ncbi:MAG: hypothetical protein COA94_04710 [Rickettsiales bacterium]|nr:MAG: hypothetical protein COA94_04710 [Rickettsiales bacterium]